MAKIFVMIKPWSINYSIDIFYELDMVGKRLETKVIKSIPEEAVRLQHIEYKDASFFQLMINDLTGQQGVIALYEGDQNAFNRQNEILRERFGGDIVPLPPLKRNVLHISASEQEFDRDFNAWRGYLNEY